MKIIGGLAAVAVLFGVVAVGANAQDVSKASKAHVQMQAIKKASDYEALPAGSTIAMACSKCKSVVVLGKKEAATKPGHGTVEEKLMVHQCPGCGGMITTKSGGKETEMAHICSKCGDDSAYCCAEKPGEKTKGM